MEFSFLENTQLIDSIFGGDKDFALSTLKEFSGSFFQDIDKIDKYISDSEDHFLDIKAILHKLKPSFYYIGQDSLTNEIEGILKGSWRQNEDFINILNKLQNLHQDIINYLNNNT